MFSRIFQCGLVLQIPKRRKSANVPAVPSGEEGEALVTEVDPSHDKELFDHNIAVRRAAKEIEYNALQRKVLKLAEKLKVTS